MREKRAMFLIIFNELEEYIPKRVTNEQGVDCKLKHREVYAHWNNCKIKFEPKMVIWCKGSNFHIAHGLEPEKEGSS
jgi:hypothetical protein